MTAKTCTKCKQEKPEEAFGTKKTRAGSVVLRSHCKACTNAKGRADYAADPAPTIARTTAYNKANPEKHREAARNSMAKRRREQPEAVREIHRRWAAANPEAVAENDRRKREQNPDLYRKIGRKKQATRRARVARAYFEDVDPGKIWVEDGGLCHLCGGQADSANWHLDHIIPLAMSGAHSRQNVAVSHPRCNQSKNDQYVPSARGLFGSWVLRPVSCR
jgi:5-methylcytosine-specific restriction endonuclease McrA